ncbi:hypothetical protein Dda3937_03217 [Dickeya dadantii 3937]|uniref:Uncharacterized protein n=1 Tax=Dickeya dadantii (strain 3937) TaxID=198628 RepID=E0SME9_DICD3|nr:hypothetical protein Dda3937_03217 [Dickeya dadantii 3937]
MGSAMAKPLAQEARQTGQILERIKNAVVRQVEQIAAQVIGRFAVVAEHGDQGDDIDGVQSPLLTEQGGSLKDLGDTAVIDANRAEFVAQEGMQGVIIMMNNYRIIHSTPLICLFDGSITSVIQAFCLKLHASRCGRRNTVRSAVKSV